ncbi:MAG TPA: hypothetical protein VFW48_02190 [Solirubrobacterales bacterium]|nr:hypothetical protein [Solirubrobacterales bacterium]
MKSVDDSEIARIRDALSSVERGGGRSSTLPIPTALLELEQWLEDERQWAHGSAKDWVALLDDLASAWSRTGPELRAALQKGAGGAAAEAGQVRNALKQKAERDRSMQRRLELAAESIRSALLREQTLGAAWRDLIIAEGVRESRGAARVLSRLTALAGHGGDLFERLQRILADDGHAIAIARGEPLPPNFDAPGGASGKERLQLAEAQITSLPRSGEVVVWLLFAFAPKMWPPVLEVGERLTLYDVGWLRQVCERGGSASYRVAPEVEEDPRFLSVLLPTVEKPKEGPLPPLAPRAVDADEKVPRVAVRLDLGEVRISEAEALARSSAEALVALADLHDADSPWVLEKSFVMLIDGRPGGSTFASPAAFSLTTDQRVAVSSDTTTEVIAKHAEHWADHFPITDLRMRQAAHLLLWLRKAREAWSPGRLILCDRVIERVAAWAEVSTPRRFLRDYSKLPWALNQVRGRLTGVVYSAFLSLSDVERADAAAWEKYQKAHEEIQYDAELQLSLGEKTWTVMPGPTIGKLSWLLERVPPGSLAAEELGFLSDRTRSGPALAAWLEELMAEFDAMESRWRRLRNSLTHGGPASDESAEEILEFVESVAVGALHTSMQGRFDETELVDFFLERRGADERLLAALRAGADPTGAIWPQYTK